MTGALLGIGSQLQRGDGASPEVFTTIAEITNIGGPTLTAGTVDATNMDSPDRYAEFIAGLKDGGEVSFTLNFIPTEATHIVTTGFLADFVANPQPLRNYTLLFPDSPATSWTFAAIITAAGAAIPTDDKITMDVTLKVSGAPTLA